MKCEKPSLCPQAEQIHSSQDDVVITFGKEKGKNKTFGNIFENEPKYIKWILTLKGTYGQVHQFKNYCLRRNGLPEERETPPARGAHALSEDAEARESAEQSTKLAHITVTVQEAELTV